MKRIAFYGGSFDPPHKGHLAIAHALMERFKLDEFVFIPAFHAPHKTRKRPTSAFDRFAMLCLITEGEADIKVSKMEIEMPERPYSVETLGRLKAELTGVEIFFVMGADSWMDITTWREWETVLSLTNHIVVTRPGYEIGFDHVTDAIRERIIDLRNSNHRLYPDITFEPRIYITDAVDLDISATDIRHKIACGNASWEDSVPRAVANYIKKYQIYS